MKSKNTDRRQFLAQTAALAGLAVADAVKTGAAQEQRSEPTEAKPNDPSVYGNRSRFDSSGRAFSVIGGPHHPHTWLTPLQDSHGIITPSGLHFWEDHGRVMPVQQFDAKQHRLMIHGMVDRPRIYTMDELKRLPAITRTHFVECNANGRPLAGAGRDSVQQTFGKASCSEWTGVLLSVLLKESGLQKGGNWLLLEGADVGNYTVSLPIEKAMDDTILVYGQNGEDIRPEQGYPLRLLAPGWQGHNQVKYLRQIKVVDQPYMSKWESGSNADDWPDGKSRWYRYEQGPRSIVLRPCPEYPISGHGYYQVNGLAWSGNGAIRKVEVSTDGGKSWKEAQLDQPVHRMAFTRFRFDWQWTGEEVVVQSRCMDESGEVQPTIAELAKIKGVAPDKVRSYFEFPSGRIDHINAIQPWRVSHDGTVTNALFS